MSITFYIATMDDDDMAHPLHRCDYTDLYCKECITHEMNLANDNARDLVEWLELREDGPQFGEIRATELAAKCRRRLWDEPRNHDPEVTPEESAQRLGVEISEKVIITGRDPGYLREKTEKLLAIAETAGENYVCWS